MSVCRWPGRRSRHSSAGSKPGPAVRDRKSAHPPVLVPCERCGYPVDLETRAARSPGLPVLCSGCATDEQAAEEFYRSGGSD